jgi:hypothetical protein
MCISVAKLQNILDVTKQIMKIFLTFFRVNIMCVERQIVRENQSGVKVSSVKVSKTFRSVDSSHLIINIFIIKCPLTPNRN